MQEENIKYHTSNLEGHRFGKLTVLKEDVNNKRYLLCKCDCGNLITVRADYLFKEEVQSCGCLKSKGERKITEVLQKNHYIYKTQYSFSNLYYKSKKYPLKFDFAIFENNCLKCLIEYQGEQHYLIKPRGYYTEQKLKEIKERDNLKREYCIKNEIKLIEISYLDYDKINLKFLEELIYG